MKAKKVNIDTIYQNPNNPRIIKDIKFRKLVKSIRDFPQMLEIRPIVVNKDKVVLGGNMRLTACLEAGLKQVYIVEVDLNEEQEKEFIIKDNIGFGEWDWDILANEWDSTQLSEWGLDAWQNMDDIETSDSFELTDQERNPFEQQTFTLASEQSEYIKEAIGDVKKTEAFKYVETFGNENSNGNALYLIVSEWAKQNK